jgi:hypothetical protein
MNSKQSESDVPEPSGFNFSGHVHQAVKVHVPIMYWRSHHELGVRKCLLS